MIGSRADLDSVSDAEYLDRIRAACSRTVTNLAEPIVAPTFDGTRRERHAGVRGARC